VCGYWPEGGEGVVCVIIRVRCATGDWVYQGGKAGCGVGEIRTEHLTEAGLGEKTGLPRGGRMGGRLANGRKGIGLFL